MGFVRVGILRGIRSAGEKDGRKIPALQHSKKEIYFWAVICFYESMFNGALDSEGFSGGMACTVQLHQRA